MAYADQAHGFPGFSLDGRWATHSEAQRMLTRTVESIFLLGEWAAAEAERAHRRTTPSREDRKKGDTARDELYRQLVGIWVHVFDKKTRIGVNEGSGAEDMGNPMVRFIAACLRPIGIKNSHSAIRARLRSLREKGLLGLG